MTVVTSYAPGTPAWTDLATGNPDEARVFYSGLLGWEFHIGGPELGGYTYCLADGHRVAGMIPAGSSESVWTTYMATDDVDAVATRFIDAGGAVMLGPADAGPAGRVVVGRDPTGAAVGAWQAREHLGSQLMNEPGAVVWNELHTPDLAAASQFYSAVFDYTWDHVDTGGGGPAYRTFSVDGNLAGGAQEMSDAPTAAEAYWLPYFGVADTDAAVQSVERLGGRILQPTQDSPYGRLAIVADPHDATFAVIAAGDEPS